MWNKNKLISNAAIFNKTLNSDKITKMNLHNKKEKQVISAPAILAHFMARARSAV
jgi:hypothetical protein